MVVRFPPRPPPTWEPAWPASDRRTAPPLNAGGPGLEALWTFNAAPGDRGAATPIDPFPPVATIFDRLVTSVRWNLESCSPHREVHLGVALSPSCEIDVRLRSSAGQVYIELRYRGAARPAAARLARTLAEQLALAGLDPDHVRIELR